MEGVGEKRPVVVRRRIHITVGFEIGKTGATTDEKTSLAKSYYDASKKYQSSMVNELRKEYSPEGRHLLALHESWEESDD
jgi:hypothetical protein